MTVEVEDLEIIQQRTRNKNNESKTEFNQKRIYLHTCTALRLGRLWFAAALQIVVVVVAVDCRGRVSLDLFLEVS